MAYLWVKAIHIVMVMSWVAGLFYLPRIYVNLALETHPAAIQRLLLMARKLFRFMTMLAVLALASGISLWLWLWTAPGPGAGWLHVKLVIVLLLVLYHAYCGYLLKKFEAGGNTHSHRWYRVFNELPVLAVLAIVILAVVKPF